MAKRRKKPEPLPGQKALAPEVEGKPNILFWIAQLDAAKKAAAKSMDWGEDAYREYLGTHENVQVTKGAIGQNETRFPIYWSSSRTVEPALYSRTPEVQANVMFDDLDDNMARLGCLASERLGKYLIHNNPFDRVIYAARNDFIHVAKTTNRVCFDYDSTLKSEKKFYTQVQSPPDPNNPQAMPMMQWIDAEGETLEDASALQRDENGDWFQMSDEETIDSVRSELQPVFFKDILHTPNARYWEEITWISFKALMTREDVIERWSEEIANEITFSDAVETSDGKKKEYLPVAYAKIWEIWDKAKKKVYWYAEGYVDEFLEVKDDPYELQGFFPCPPFMLGTVGVDSLYPVPDYVQLKPFILQLHALARRFKTLVRASRRRGLYDKGVKELERLGSEADEAEFLACNLKQVISEKGSLANLVFFFPQQEIVDAINQMAEVIQNYKDAFNEAWGIPDIVRGSTDPNETAAAQQMKGQWMSLRFSAVQREFQRFVRDDIELLCDLSLKKFPDTKLAEICGVRFWEPEDQQLWPQVLMLLRDDTERKVRIDIETDSTITMNQEADLARRNETAKTLIDGIAALATSKQQDPNFVAVVAQALLYVVQGTPKGKEIEQRLEQAIQATLNPPPQGPPPPDPAVMKAQAQIEAIQIKSQAQQQLDSQKFQGQMALQQQKVQGEQQLEATRAQADMAIEGQKAQASAQVDSQKAAQDMQIAHESAQQKMMEHIIDAKLKIWETQLMAKLEIGKQQHQQTLDKSAQEFEQKQEAKRTTAETLAAFTEPSVQR